MSTKYFNQKQEGFEHLTLEEWNILQEIRKQKVKEMEEIEEQRREKEWRGIV